MLMVPFLAAGNFYFFKSYQPEKTLKVIDVIDGDTFVTEEKMRVRLMSVDAPELDRCGGQEAKKGLEKLLNNKQVVLKEAVADKFGRLVALVYVDNFLINQAVLKQGWGRYGGSDNSQRDNLKQAGGWARENKLGLYAPECYQTENIDQPGCLIKANFDNKIYHFPGCSGYNVVVVEKDLGDEWFCSEKEAEAAGYVKSKQCFEKEYN